MFFKCGHISGDYLRKRKYIGFANSALFMIFDYLPVRWKPFIFNTTHPQVKALITVQDGRVVHARIRPKNVNNFGRRRILLKREA